MTIEDQLREWLDKHGAPPESIAMHPITRKLAIPQVGDSLAPFPVKFGDITINFISSAYLEPGTAILMAKAPKLDFSTGMFDDEDLNGFVKLRWE